MIDLALVQRAQTGDNTAADTLIRRWRSLVVRVWTDGYFLPGADRDDLDQEALLGFLKAIRDYQPDHGVPFLSFARICVRRHLATALITATRGKHRLLTETVRAGVNDDGEETSILELLPSGSPPLELQLEQREELTRLARGLRIALTPREAQALLLTANGVSYRHVVQLTGMAEKTIDNALQRALVKLAAFDGAAAVENARCPSCGGETVRRLPSGQRRRGPGRPGKCTVCQTRTAAA
jgi:RNA polymerase sporulation-specific sigma factor